MLLLATEGFGGLSPNRRSIFNDRMVFGGYERTFHGSGFIYRMVGPE